MWNNLVIFSENLIFFVFYPRFMLYYGTKGNKTMKELRKSMSAEAKPNYTLGSVKNALRLLQSFTLDTPEKKSPSSPHLSAWGKARSPGC